jgi:hypothetical protein
MKKNYLYIITFLSVLFSLSVSAQEIKQPARAVAARELSTELGFYPNPASNGKIYISSKTSLEKDIFIFDVLGKLVLQATVVNKELNISALSAGVYIIKIKEGEVTATRKLIVR